MPDFFSPPKPLLRIAFRQSVLSGRVIANNYINCPMGSRRKIVDRYYLAELRSELNERLDVEKARDRATYFQFELFVRVPGNLGRT